MLNRRRLLQAGALIAVAPLAAACSRAGEEIAAAPTDASAPDAAAFPRTVEHELGGTAIPAAPGRVVCGTDGGELCSLLALGVVPVGFGQRNDPLSPWVRELAEGIETYDLSSGETSYERLAAWAPDLLLVQVGFATEESLPRFGDIAPTVATSFIDWRTNLRQVAAAVGLDDEAERLEADTDAAVTALGESLASDHDVSGFRLRAVAAFTDGSVYSFNADSPLGKVAGAMGLPALPAARTPGEALDQISREELDLLDGDLLLVMSFDDAPNGNADLSATELWQRLAVVRDGGVVDVGPDEANQLYFDSVLTVEPNARVLDRLIRARLA